MDAHCIIRLVIVDTDPNEYSTPACVMYFGGWRKGQPIMDEVREFAAELTKATATTHVERIKAIYAERGLTNYTLEIIS